MIDLPEMPAPAVTYADHSHPAYSKRQVLDFAAAAVELVRAQYEIELAQARAQVERWESRERVAKAIAIAFHGEESEWLCFMTKANRIIDTLSHTSTSRAEPTPDAPHVREADCG